MFLSVYWLKNDKFFKLRQQLPNFTHKKEQTTTMPQRQQCLVLVHRSWMVRFYLCNSEFSRNEKSVGIFTRKVKLIPVKQPPIPVNPTQWAKNRKVCLEMFQCLRVESESMWREVITLPTRFLTGQTTEPLTAPCTDKSIPNNHPGKCQSFTQLIG